MRFTLCKEDHKNKVPQFVHVKKKAQIWWNVLKKNSNTLTIIKELLWIPSIVMRHLHNKPNALVK